MSKPRPPHLRPADQRSAGGEPFASQPASQPASRLTRARLRSLARLLACSGRRVDLAARPQWGANEATATGGRAKQEEEREEREKKRREESLDGLLGCSVQQRSGKCALLWAAFVAVCVQRARVPKATSKQANMRTGELRPSANEGDICDAAAPLSCAGQLGSIRLLRLLDQKGCSLFECGRLSGAKAEAVGKEEAKAKEDKERERERKRRNLDLDSCLLFAPALGRLCKRSQEQSVDAQCVWPKEHNSVLQANSGCCCCCCCRACAAKMSPNKRARASFALRDIIKRRRQSKQASQSVSQSVS